MKTRKTECAGNSGETTRRSNARRTLGLLGEEEGVRYLTGRGYAILERGFRMFRGEIDIIARRDEILVFFEVKTRSGDEFGFPVESVTAAKQRQVRKIALGYLLKHGLAEEKTACRFDVLSVICLGESRFRLTHYENAF